jgi:hypothetical protein
MNKQSLPTANPLTSTHHTSEKKKECKIIRREFKRREKKSRSIINYVLEENKFHGQKE